MLLVTSGVPRILENMEYLHTARGPGGPLVPATLFPFATDADRGFLLMSLAGKDRGAIYLYFPGSDPWGTGNNNYLGHIADSFAAFMTDSLRPYE